MKTMIAAFVLLSLAPLMSNASPSCANELSRQGLVDARLNRASQQWPLAMISLLTFTADGELNADLKNSEDTAQICAGENNGLGVVLSKSSQTALILYRYFVSQGLCPMVPGNLGGDSAYDLESCLNSSSAILSAIQLVNASSVDINAMNAQLAIGQALLETKSACSAGNEKEWICPLALESLAAGGGNPRETAVSFISGLFQ